MLELENSIKARTSWPFRLDTFLFVLAVSITSSLLAEPSSEFVRYEIAVTIVDNSDVKMERIGTKMKIRNWHSQDGENAVRCFYVPFNNASYDFDPARNFDLIPQRYAKSTRRQGNTAVQVAGENIDLEWVEPYLLRVGLPEGLDSIELASDSVIPRWPDAANDEWFYADFFPLPLLNCPRETKNPLSFEVIPQAEIKGSLNVPKSWRVASNAVEPDFVTNEDGSTTHAVAINASKFAFGLAQDYSRVSENVNGVKLDVFFRSVEFQTFLPTVKWALDRHTKIFGQLPFPKLAVVETAELERSALPGLVTLNRPHQPGLDKVQMDVLNWSQWQLTTFIAEQWFGAATMSSLNDFWFLRGMVDFAAGIALRSDPKTHDLFADDGGIAAKMSFTYRQTQDLIAAALTYLQPENALTDANGSTKDEFEQQHALSYMRHSLAMRQVFWTLGEEKFQKVLESFLVNYQFKQITPRDFLDHLQQARVTDSSLPETERMLVGWWATDKWPNYYIQRVRTNENPSENGASTWTVQIEIGSTDEFRYPVDVLVVDENGNKHVSQTGDSDASGISRAIFTIGSPPDKVIVDSDHKTFDWNRFDNNNLRPKFAFLPGGAKTFASDAYTIFWLPLFSKLPGEPFTLMLAAQGFKYIHSGFTGVLTQVPSEDRVGGSFHYLSDFPQIGGYTVVDYTQDRGLASRGERIIQAGFYKMPFLIKDPTLEVGVQFRNRQTLGQPESNHQVVSLRTMLVPMNSYGTCKYFLKTDHEIVIPTANKDIDYHRNSFFGDGSCRVFPGLDLGLRAFSGTLHVSKTAPPNSFYIPQDLKEARLRIDNPLIGPVGNISTIGADILVPFFLPLPDQLYVLSRDARWRFFYDYGESTRPNGTYADAGIGMLLPFGGDLVGKGSLTVLNFSALLVLYRNINGSKNYEPGLLLDFDFFGKL